VRKAELFFRAGCLVSVACLVLAGGAACGSKDSSTSVSGGSASKAHKSSKAKAGNPGEASLADMVAAVSSARSGPPVEMKFSLHGRPEVGQDVDLDVALVPRAPIPDSFAASFSASEGLEVVEGAQMDRVEKLTNGVPIHHLVKIRPTRDGIFALSAVVSIDQANQDLVRTFSIPVIAGEGLREQVAKGP
jgi:hypothetical protein